MDYLGFKADTSPTCLVDCVQCLSEIYLWCDICNSLDIQHLTVLVHVLHICVHALVGIELSNVNAVAQRSEPLGHYGTCTDIGGTQTLDPVFSDPLSTAILTFQVSITLIPDKARPVSYFTFNSENWFNNFGLPCLYCQCEKKTKLLKSLCFN